MVFAFHAYKSQFLDPSQRFVGAVLQYRVLAMHVDCIAEIALEQPEQVKGTESLIGRAPPVGHIKLRAVRFKYGRDDPEILQGVNLAIAPGEPLAITGPSGGGKSTLVKLVTGLHEPTGGQIPVDGETRSPRWASALCAACLRPCCRMMCSMQEAWRKTLPSLIPTGVSNA